jgi:hypothetical protein
VYSPYPTRFACKCDLTAFVTVLGSTLGVASVHHMCRTLCFLGVAAQSHFSDLLMAPQIFVRCGLVLRCYLAIANHAAVWPELVNVSRTLRVQCLSA